MNETTLPQEALDFDRFLNEPPEFEDRRSVREFRHDAYRRWEKVCDAFRAALAAREAPTIPDLHAAIMNLPCKPYDGTDSYTHYCRGHRDARHAAAELALSAAPASPLPSAPSVNKE